MRKKKAKRSEQKKEEFEEKLKKKAFTTTFVSEIKNLNPRERGRRCSDSRVNTKLVKMSSPKSRRQNSLVYIKKKYEAYIPPKPKILRNELKTDEFNNIGEGG